MVLENNKKEKAVLILSGGMDSTTLLYDIVRLYDVYAISFNYNQRHKRELEMAQKTCQKLNVNHKIVDISSINEILKGSSLTSDNIATPIGKYNEENMKATVVPNRNMILLSLAAGYAISIDIKKLFYGAHAGDHAIYPDCRHEFVIKLAEALKICDWNPIYLIAPYLHKDKGDIAIIGKKLNVDYSLTYSCYEGKEIPCGKCGACNERAEAFAKAEMEDPLLKMHQE